MIILFAVMKLDIFNWVKVRQWTIRMMIVRNNLVDWRDLVNRNWGHSFHNLGDIGDNISPGTENSWSEWAVLLGCFKYLEWTLDLLVSNSDNNTDMLRETYNFI